MSQSEELEMLASDDDNEEMNNVEDIEIRELLVDIFLDEENFASEDEIFDE